MSDFRWNEIAQDAKKGSETEEGLGCAAAVYDRGILMQQGKEVG